MDMQKVTAFLLMPQLCLLVACGSTSNLQGEEQAKTIDLAPYSQLLVEDFTDDATARAQGYRQLILKPKVDRAAKAFPNWIAESVRSSGGFSSVERTGTPGASTLVLRGVIHQYDDGNASLRKILGFWAGNTNFDSTVQLVDGGSGNVLGSWKIDKNSFSYLGTDMTTPAVTERGYAPTPEVFMQEAARKIAEELSERKRVGQITAPD
jgi:hypothetical protein